LNRSLSPAFNNDWWPVIVLVPLFLIPLIHTWGLVISIALCIAGGASVYGIRHMEFLLMLTLYAPIIKASPLNPIPEAIDLTVLFYALFLLLAAVLFLFRQWALPRLDMPDLLLLAYLLLVCIDFFHSPQEVREYALFKLIRFSILSVPFYFFAKLLDSRAYRHAAWLFAILGAAICLALFLVFPTAIQIKGAGNSYLTMAKLAGITLLFAAVLFVQETRPVRKLVFGTAMLIGLLLVFKTNSRAGILFAPTVLLVYLGIIFRHKKILAIFTVLVLILATLVTYQLYPDFFTRFFLIFKSHKGSSINLRLTLYDVSKRILAERWFSGIGLGGFARYHYLNYPHNFILESFLEHGLAGGLLILSWVGYLVQRWLRFLKRGGLHTPEAGFFLASVYLFLFFMTSFGLESMRLLLFFAGAMMALGNLTDGAAGTTPGAGETPDPSPRQQTAP